MVHIILLKSQHFQITVIFQQVQLQYLTTVHDVHHIHIYLQAAFYKNFIGCRFTHALYLHWPASLTKHSTLVQLLIYCLYYISTDLLEQNSLCLTASSQAASCQQTLVKELLLTQ